jgi:hypothetical protein
VVLGSAARRERVRAGVVSVAAVHLAAVPHVFDPDRSAVVVDRTQDAPVALPDPEPGRPVTGFTPGPAAS